MALANNLSVRITRKIYSKRETLALGSLSLSVPPGQFVALVGPSGAGKTTLLNIVAGLDRDFDGEVLRPTEMAPTGMVFQTPRLMPWLTVLENLSLVLGPDPDLDTARTLLAELELQEFIDAYPRQLSGGMQRRVSLARAFVIRPRLLLMDEPFLSLDDPLAWRLRQQLLTMWLRDRPTVLYITHDLDESLFLADRIVFLSARPGRVILDQTITASRPRKSDRDSIAKVRDELLARHPELLSGRADTATSNCGAPIQPTHSREAPCR